MSSNNVSEDGYGSRPGSRDGTGMNSGMPVSASGRITGDHMNGNYSRGNTPGISGICCSFGREFFVERCVNILLECELLQVWVVCAASLIPEVLTVFKMVTQRMPQVANSRSSDHKISPS